MPSSMCPTNVPAHARVASNLHQHMTDILNAQEKTKQEKTPQVKKARHENAMLAQFGPLRSNVRYRAFWIAALPDTHAGTQSTATEIRSARAGGFVADIRGLPDGRVRDLLNRRRRS